MAQELGERHNWWRAVRRALRKLRWPLIAFLFLLAFGLGVLGFSMVPQAPGSRRTPLDIIYLSLQLFVLQSGDVRPEVPWPLEIARFLAPAVTAGAAIQALLAVLGEQFQMLRLWLLFRNHVVVCGLGRKGLQVARDYLKAGKRVVVIEAEEDNGYIAACRDLGAVVLTGNSTHELVLRKAYVQRAKRMFAVCGGDTVNIDTAFCAYRLIEKSSRPGAGVLVCHILIADSHLGTLLRSHPIFSGCGVPFKATVFDVYVNSARLLLADSPLDRERITASDLPRVHLVVVGFGHMGESIALQAARIAHYANGRTLRLSVVTLDAEKRKRAFYDRYPRFGDVCDATFLDADIGDPATLEQIVLWATEKDFLVSIVVCFDDDSRSISCAVAVALRLRGADIPVVARVAEDGGLADIMRPPAPRVEWARHIHVFGATSRACSIESIVNEGLDKMARASHEDFVEKRLGEGRPKADPSMAAWDVLDGGLKDSSRQAADHIPVKLRAIGCERRPLANPGPGWRPHEFTDDDVEVMARMEHARWYAERVLANWTRGPRDVAKRQNPYLIRWHDPELHENVKEYDRQAVRNIPALLKKVGEGVFRAEGGTG